MYKEKVLRIYPYAKKSKTLKIPEDIEVVCGINSINENPYLKRVISLSKKINVVDNKIMYSYHADHELDYTYEDYPYNDNPFDEEDDYSSYIDDNDSYSPIDKDDDGLDDYKQGYFPCYYTTYEQYDDALDLEGDEE